jgi:hypothetical protein
MCNESLFGHIRIRIEIKVLEVVFFDVVFGPRKTTTIPSISKSMGNNNMEQKVTHCTSLFQKQIKIQLSIII